MFWQVKDELTDAQQTGICELLMTTFHKGTEGGNETPSLLMAKAISEVPKYAYEATARPTGRAP